MKKIKLLRHLFLFMVTLPSLTFAQLDDAPRNLPKYDHEKMHFGFLLGFNSSDFVINRVGDLKIRDTIYDVESEPVTGLNLGIISNFKLNEYFALRFIPTLAFGQRNLNYHFIYNDSSQAFTTKNIESTYLEFPFDLKFKSKRVNNFGIYVLAGFKYALDMVSQSQVKNKEKDIIKLKRVDYGYEIGLGFDCYLSYFKFSPEIKMYNGLTNLLIHENTPYVNPIDALYSKTFVISFTFEGGRDY